MIAIRSISISYGQPPFYRGTTSMERAMDGSAKKIASDPEGTIGIALAALILLGFAIAGLRVVIG